MKSVPLHYLSIFAFGLFLLSGCEDDDVPPAENEEEVINEVTLTFTPAAGGAARAFTYVDPDGEGTTPPTQDDIILETGVIYTMTINLSNTIGDTDEDISQEVREEGDEHQIFFSWTGTLFTSPTGLGNIGEGNQDNNLNYTDTDSADLPIGLTTIWETAENPVEGTFRILLKHQPNVKSADISSEVGTTDVDITWNIAIQ